MSSQSTTSEQQPATTGVSPVVDPAQQRRAGIYQLLGALLRTAPTESVLDYVTRLEGDGDGRGNDLSMAFPALALAARHSEPTALRHEYQALFIGLGRGELVPYGSWYQTGFLMEKPLGLLREDLARLGFERADDIREPEDHIAALCEVMAYLIADDYPIEVQQHFFESHLGNWAPAFFADLGAAQSAVFYRSVARLGSAFVELEARYLALNA